MKVGKKNPRIRTTIDRAIAIIIRPIVIGSFKTLKFIIEKKEDRIRSKALNSKISNFWVSSKEYVWVVSSTKKNL